MNNEVIAIFLAGVIACLAMDAHLVLGIAMAFGFMLALQVASIL